MDTTSVCWNLTSACNMSCQYCFRELSESAQSLEVNMGILDNLIAMGVKRITFSGGEPFMYPYLLDLINKAHEAGIKCYVVTNGSLLNEENVRALLEHIDKITFSCDSPREIVNETIGRSTTDGKDSYRHIRNIIPLIRYYYPDILIDINTVVTYDPYHEYRELDYMIDAIRNDLLKNDINKWKIIRFYPLSGKASSNKDRFSLDNDEFLEIKKEYESMNGYLKIDVRDIKDIDDNLIVSPCGYLKQSLNGEETILVDLKPSLKKGCERHV